MNKPLILTVLGCAGVGLTGFLAVKNTEKLCDIRRVREEEGGAVSKKEAALTYLPTLIVGTATCGCIVASHVLSAKQLAAVTGALGIVSARGKEALEELREKHPDVYNEIMNDVNQRHLKEKCETEKFPVGENGRKPYYDSWSDQLFQATEAEILQAECYLNECLFNTGEATLYDYFATFPKECGIELKEWMKYVGWFEGDTSYSYNAGYFGSYVKPCVERQNLEIDGVIEDVNVINWFISPDVNVELDKNEQECVITAMNTGTDI